MSKIKWFYVKPKWWQFKKNRKYESILETTEEIHE